MSLHVGFLYLLHQLPQMVYIDRRNLGKPEKMIDRDSVKLANSFHKLIDVCRGTTLINSFLRRVCKLLRFSVHIHSCTNCSKKCHEFMWQNVYLGLQKFAFYVFCWFCCASCCTLWSDRSFQYKNKCKKTIHLQTYMCFAFQKRDQRTSLFHMMVFVVSSNNSKRHSRSTNEVGTLATMQAEITRDPYKTVTKKPAKTRQLHPSMLVQQQWCGQ